jgi:RNA polymerase sigma-70 factor (TIGR02960 family)
VQAKIMSITTDPHTGAQDFGRLAEPYRRELVAYGYRMLGSIDDAEEVVQDIYLEAWRGYDRFEGRSSLRTWLYRIATRAFVTAAKRRRRRPLPSDVDGAASSAAAPILGAPDVLWLQPAPDALLSDTRGQDPASVVVARQTMRLAFVAALQVLPPQQRAVLILREVLQWRAAEVAALLDISTAAVNSALQRARTRLPADHDSVIEPSDRRQRELIDRYVAAFENADVDALIAVLTDDATFEMPPFRTWFRGASVIGAFLGARMAELGTASVVRSAANGQPAVALYVGADGDRRRLHALHVLTLQRHGVSRVVAFQEPAALLRFGLATHE